MTRYLRGPFAPVRGERADLRLPVSGRLPDDLDGLFVQIGPSPAGRPRRTLDGRYPWLMQDGLLCGVRLRGGRAEWFRRRWIRSRAAARPLHTRPAPGPRHLPVDTVNTNVVAHHGTLLALVESGCLPVQLSETLDSVRYTDLDGQLPHGFSAHPKIDPATGALHALAYSPLRTWAEYLVLDTAGRIGTARRVELGGRPLLHDIALTPRHVVFFDLPVRFDAARAAARAFPFRWRDGHPARIGVLPRDGGPLRWVHIDPCFLYHVIGAHETADGGLVVRGIRYDRLHDDPDADPLGEWGTPWEWHVPPGADHARARPLDDRPQEMPGTDPRRTGVAHRFFHTTTRLGPDRHGIFRFDLDRGTGTVHPLPPGTTSGEIVFVARPGGVAETDGWLLHYRGASASDTSSLVVCDARDHTAEPLAVIELPARVPAGAHSTWVPAEQLPGTAS